MMPFRSALLAVGLAACATASQTGPSVAALDAYIAELHVAPATAAAFTARCDAGLALAGEHREALESASGTASVARDLQAFDDLYRLVATIFYESSLVSETHPSEDIRAAAEECYQEVSAFDTQTSLSRPIYDRLAAIDARRADTVTQYTLTQTLQSYRRSGVDRDEATRAEVERLSNEITEIGLDFSRNIRDDETEVTFASTAALDGLPADYIEAHQPGQDGLIRITMAYPDVFPIISYARSEETRRQVFMAFNNRAYPANEPVLRSLLEKRYELARLLGYDNYASLITEDKMVGAPANARAFLEQLAVAARPNAERDFRRLEARLRRDNLGATLQPWSGSYVSHLIQTEEYNVDPQEVRRYFRYNNVRDGMLALVSDLFGVEFRPWVGAPVWHESVSAYEVYEDSQLIGRIFLDMHPRDGKFSHAAQFTLRDGVAGKSVPIGALICNFPSGDELMEHGDVETFLHEFGHLIHTVFSGNQRYALQYLEWDFTEAPSTLLEEWVWDYDTLARFARDADGAVIPRDLVERMNAARFFGQAGGTMTQIGYAAMSLDYYDRDPAGINLQEIQRLADARYSLYPWDNTHSYANFGHLDGYSAIYYTYEWSRSIALDLFTRFEANGMRDPATARAYRDLVLAPGGTRPAAELVEDFLGRPPNLDAYRNRLAR